MQSIPLLMVMYKPLCPPIDCQYGLLLFPPLTPSCPGAGAPSQRFSWSERSRLGNCTPSSVWRRSTSYTATWRMKSMCWGGKTHTYARAHLLLTLAYTQQRKPRDQAACVTVWLLSLCLSCCFRIKHENVVGLEDFYETRTHYYLVMQLWVESSLSQMMNEIRSD